MKKIILTCSGIPALGIHGGIISYVHELANTLALANYDVHVFVFREYYDKTKTYNKELYKYKIFELPQKRCEERDFVLQIIQEIKTLNPDIIINNEIVYIQGIYPVIDNKTIKISVVHGFARNRTMSIAGMQGKISTYNWQWTDWIVCQNKQMAQGIIKKYNVAENKVVAINQTCQKLTEAKTLPEEVFTIVYAGGGSKNKGSLEAYGICKKLSKSDKNFKFIWCLNPVKNIDKELSSDSRFIFTGKLDRNKFIETLNNADCIIIPSHMETGPMLLVEAMSTGTIPICNDIKYSAIPDIIINGENGFKIKNNNINKYIEIIYTLCYSKDKILKIKTNAINFYTEYLTPDSQRRQFEKLFVKNPQNIQNVQKLSDKNIIHSTTHYNVSKMSLFSILRIFSKAINFLEIIIDENRFNKWGHIFLK